MQWRNTVSRFGITAATLHWIIVAGIIGQYFLAEAGEDQEASKDVLLAPMNLHSSLGMTLLLLAVIRLLWRMVDAPPSWPAGMKRFEIILARTLHAAFYVLLFAIPLSGWMLSSSEADLPQYFGTFQIPALLPHGSESTADLLEDVHEFLFNTLFVLALLHAAAALKHHFLDRDDVMRRMLGGR